MRYAAVLLLVGLMLGCANPGDAAAGEAERPRFLNAWEPLSIATPVSTETPMPPEPTVTPVPTATPEPTATATPKPTATPEPTPTPEPSAPVVLELPPPALFRQLAFEHYKPVECANLLTQSNLDINSFHNELEKLGADPLAYPTSWRDYLPTVAVETLTDIDRALWQSILAQSSRNHHDEGWMFVEGRWAISCVPLWAAPVTYENQRLRNDGDVCIPPIPTSPEAQWVLEAVMMEIYYLAVRTPYLELSPSDRIMVIQELGPLGCGRIYPQLFYGMWIPDGLNTSPLNEYIP